MKTAEAHNAPLTGKIEFTDLDPPTERGLRRLREMLAEKFWGKAHLSMEDGKILHAVEEKSRKF